MTHCSCNTAAWDPDAPLSRFTMRSRGPLCPRGQGPLGADVPAPSRAGRSRRFSCHKTVSSRRERSLSSAPPGLRARPHAPPTNDGGTDTHGAQEMRPCVCDRSGCETGRALSPGGAEDKLRSLRPSPWSVSDTASIAPPATAPGRRRRAGSAHAGTEARGYRTLSGPRGNPTPACNRIEAMTRSPPSPLASTASAL
jgi:hypothetical protein